VVLKAGGDEGKNNYLKLGHYPLYLRVGDDDRIVIAAHSTQTITKPAGTYWFYAVCPGVLPAFGERSFKIGSIYTWRFYIVTTY
jgi:hypothetical protein